MENYTVILKTNLDEYNQNDFISSIYSSLPIPRIGETFYVREERQEYFRSKKLPIRLEVVDVSYHERIVENSPSLMKIGLFIDIELWFKKIDVEFMKLNKVGFYDPMNQ